MSSEKWSHVSRKGAPDVNEIPGSRGRRRVALNFLLSAVPPTEWKEYFLGGFPRSDDGNVVASFDGPHLVIASIPSREEFKAWADRVNERIGKANAHYANELEDRKRADEALAAKNQEREEHLDEYKQWASELEPPA